MEHFAAKFESVPHLREAKVGHAVVREGIHAPAKAGDWKLEAGKGKWRAATNPL